MARNKLAMNTFKSGRMMTGVLCLTSQTYLN